MAGYRPAPQAYQYTSDEGAPLDGGSIVYSESGSSTPKAVYSDEAGTVSMGSTLTLTPAGRAPDHFLVGEYRQIVKDADGNQVSLRDNVRDQVTGGVTLPDPGDGADGDVVVVSGAGYALETILRLPDPNGSDTYMVVADGDGYSLQPQPEAADYDADNLPGGISATASASGSVVIGPVRIQWGSDTCTGTGALSQTKAVTFGTAFSGTPYHISVEPVLSGGVTSNSFSGYPATRYSSPSTTGFTAGFFVGEENLGGTDTINASIPFTWVAVGPA